MGSPKITRMLKMAVIGQINVSPYMIRVTQVSTTMYNWNPYLGGEKTAKVVAKTQWDRSGSPKNHEKCRKWWFLPKTLIALSDNMDSKIKFICIANPCSMCESYFLVLSRIFSHHFLQLQSNPDLWEKSVNLLLSRKSGFPENRGFRFME